MTLRDTELRECLKAVGAFLEKRRPPPEFREQLDYRADITGSVLLLVEVRPAYNDPTQKIERPIAKAQWISTRRAWRLSWRRFGTQWWVYQPMPLAIEMRAVLTEVDRDPHGCFFG